MAILPMKHIEIIAMQKDAKKIVDLLQRLGTVDVTERDAEDETDQLSLFPTRTSPRAEVAIHIELSAGLTAVALTDCVSDTMLQK